MGKADIGRAIEVFLHVMTEARAMAAVGNIGPELDELLRHASKLLDIVDEELSHLDRKKHAGVFASAPNLRRKLENLLDELRGGSVN